jgi:beta-galactosidase/beta-glucuronidase
MKLFQFFVLAAFLGGSTVLAASDEWRPAAGPLCTRWAKDVSPTNVWPEYPRPQMVRQNWLNLNGLWDYAIVGANAAEPSSYEGRILVPFPVESALSGVMRPLDDKSRLVYRRTFEAPKRWKKQTVLLHFGAVDWDARVFVNNTEVGHHCGGYDPFTFDITAALQPGRKQEIRVDVLDPTEAGQPRGKQSRAPEGIFYTSTSGIWQTVWLEPVPATSLDELLATPDVDHGAMRLSAKVRAAAGDETLTAIVFKHGGEIGRVSGPASAGVEIPIPQAELWSPDHPFLYDLKVELRRGKTRLDSVTSYFAMRKISLGKDARGITRPMLNGQCIFQIGPLDQGFWPDGLYTAPTDAAMRYDLEVTKKLGFNMTRKHVKVEPDRWYYDCDQLGLLVWQDMPGANNKSDADKQEFEHELRQMIATHRNHPSIVMWVVFNEGWGQFDTKRLAGLVKEIDPTRLVNNATGWVDEHAGDTVDTHQYPGPASPQPEEKRAAVLGEFGGLGLGVDGHTWTQKTWGYQGMASRDGLTGRYVTLLAKALELKESTGLSAAVYTQITDVETECNGLMTYDREIIKPDLAAVAAANRTLQNEGQ